MVQQIVLFSVLTLILTVILAGGQEATGLLAGQVILAQLAPGLAGVILALIFRKNAPGLNFSVEGITLKSVMGAVLLPLYQNGPLYMGFLVLLITSYAVVLYVLVEPISFNIWIAALFHLFINITNVVFLSVINDTPFMIGMALVWVVIAPGIVMMNRQTFLKAPRSQVA